MCFGKYLELRIDIKCLDGYCFDILCPLNGISHRMKKLYFKYLKYLFLLLLIYSMYALIVITEVRVGYTEMVLGLLFPYLPVWLSSLVAEKMDSDLAGTPLNVLVLSVPTIVMVLEVYIISTRSLVVDGTGAGLIGAFVFGTLTFFVLFGITLISTVFIKAHNKKINKDT